MILNERFNKERARKLQIEGLKEGSLLEYCPRCNFQLHPEVWSLKFCPMCKAGLISITLTKEMIELINGE